MDIFQYLNKKDALRDMSNEAFAEFSPIFANALLDYGFENLLKYYNNSLKTNAKDWNDLCNKTIEQNHISSTSTIGLSIIRRFMPHLYDVENYKGNSVKKLWVYANILKAVQVNRQSHSTPYISEIIRQIGFVAGTSKVTIYRPLLTKRIVEYFDAKEVLDVCVGWGGRMLGSACQKNVKYTGIEPYTKTFQGLQGMVEEFKLSNVTLFNDCAENVLPNMERKYDLALTSPPYYNLEVYSDENTQSHHYGSYEDWIKLFLRPVIYGVLSVLKEGGKSAWSVKNIKTDKKYNLYDDVVKIHKEKGWEKMDVEFYVGNPVRPGNNVDKNGKTNTGQEFTYIFYK